MESTESKYTVELIEFEGRRLHETWKLNNQQHAPEDQPAERTWDNKTGNLRHEAFYRFGKLHRVGAAAFTCWDPDDGSKTAEIWQINGEGHRDGDEPACWQKLLGSDFNETEEYWFNGVMHRDPEKGPAYIVRDIDSGKLIQVAYYRHGELLKHAEAATGKSLSESKYLKPLEP